MNKSLATAWVKALRSGKFKQGTGVLRDDTDDHSSHCCLGVLLEVCKTRKAFVPHLAQINEQLNKYHDLGYNGDEGNNYETSLLDIVKLDGKDEGELINMNDNGERSFKFIATWIEKKFIKPDKRAKSK